MPSAQKRPKTSNKKEKLRLRGDEWNVIDYEWTTREAYEAKEIFYRALFCYLLEDKARLECHPGKILSRLGITKELQEKYGGKGKCDEMIAFGAELTACIMDEHGLGSKD